MTGGAGRGGEMKVLYVFVELNPSGSFSESVRRNFGSEQQKLALLGTIQFVTLCIVLQRRFDLLRRTRSSL